MADDMTPPPPQPLTERFRAMKPGTSLLLESTINLTTARSTLTRVKKGLPGSDFTSRQTDDGVRVWRLS